MATKGPANAEQLKLSADEMAEFGIELAKSGPGQMDIQISLPGGRLNADRLAHVTPRLSGVVQDVFKNVGDTVRKSEVMAAVDSRELATAKRRTATRTCLAGQSAPTRKTLGRQDIRGEGLS